MPEASSGGICGLNVAYDKEGVSCVGQEEGSYVRFLHESRGGCSGEGRHLYLRGGEEASYTYPACLSAINGCQKHDGGEFDETYDPLLDSPQFTMINHLPTAHGETLYANACCSILLRDRPLNRCCAAVLREEGRVDVQSCRGGWKVVAEKTRGEDVSEGRGDDDV